MLSSARSSSSHGGEGKRGDAVDPAVNVVMLVDRLVSASTAADVIESLQGLERGLKKQQQQQQQEKSSETIPHNSLANAILSRSNSSSDAEQDNSVLVVLWKLLHKEHALVQDDENAADGVLWTCRILVQLLSREGDAHAKILLQEPSPGKMLEAFMDVVVADQNVAATSEEEEGPTAVTTSPYVRVMACQALHKLCQHQPSLAQPQLLRAPNGLHRLGDLLQVHTDEQVRNEALLLAATLAAWPAVAQVWIFSNLADRLLDLAVYSSDDDEEGGLTGGSVLTQDCCAILLNLVTHANPEMAAELLFGGGDGTAPQTFAHNMMRLLDLRQGQQFQHPERHLNQMGQPKTGQQSSSAVSKSTVEDDLDDLIASASKPKQKRGSGDEHVAEIASAEPVVVPRLLASEEVIIKTILDIWLTLLKDHPSVQKAAWRQHPAVLRMIWEMALLSPPPTPTTPYPCAVPSVSLQQYALHVVAQGLSFSVSDLDRDRLLYLVCTGGLGQNMSEKYQISFAALYVLRQAASTVLTTEMIAFAMAPPPPPELDENGNEIESPPPPENQMVVPKLLSTVSQHLTTPKFQDPNRAGGNQKDEHDMHVIGLIGSTSALGLFLRNDVSRSMMLKLVQKQPILADDPSFFDQVLLRIQEETLEKTTDNNYQVAACLLRFLANWCLQAPEVVYAILSSPHATVLSNLYNSKILSGSSLSTSSSSVSAFAKFAMAQLSGLVLGICLGNLLDEEQAAGWTRETLMQILSKRQHAVLQRKGDDDMDKSVLVWSHSEFELKAYRAWNKSTLLQVRQAMVQYLTTSDDGEDGENQDDALLATQPEASDKDTLLHDESERSRDNSGHGSSTKNSKALTQVIAQQTAELENLREELSSAQNKVTEKEKELTMFRLRVESTPTELDDLVEKTIKQNQQLQQQIDQLQKKDSETQAALQSSKEKYSAEEGGKNEARQEAEALRQDLDSMTQSYTTLEQEFQRQQQEMQQQQESMAQQEQSRQASSVSSEETASSSTQVATLRAENTRLREDAKAADSWMKMAVERFQVLEQEKVGLQQRVDQLESGAPQTESMLEQQRMQMLQEHNVVVEKLQTELTEVRNELDSVRSSHEQERDQLQTRVEDLVEQVRSAQTEATLVQSASNSSAEGEMNGLREQLSALQNELQETAKSKDELQEEIAQLRESNDAAQEWMAKAVEHHQLLSEQLAASTSEKDALEAEAKELKTKLFPLEASALLTEQLQKDLDEKTSMADQYKASLTQKEQEAQEVATERDQLKAAFETKQKEAVEMATEIEALETQLEETSAENAKLTGSSKPPPSPAGSVDQFEQVEFLRTELERKTEQIQGLLKDTEQVEFLRSELEEKTDQTQELLKQQQALQQKYTDEHTRACELDMEVAELKAELSDIEEEKEELELKKKEAEEKLALQQQPSQNDDHILELQTEKDRLTSELQSLLIAKEQEIREITEQWESRCTALENRLESAGGEHEHESTQQTAGERRSENNQNDTVQELEDQITHLREEMETQEREAADCIAEWQQSYSSVEAQCRELETRVQELESASSSAPNGIDAPVGNESLQQRIDELTTAMEEKDQEATTVISQWEESYNCLKEENELLQAQISSGGPDGTDAPVGNESLQQRIDELTTAMEEKDTEATTVISQWVESYNSLKEENEQLQAQLSSGGPDGTNTPVGSESLQQRIDELTTAMGEKDQEATTVISQWEESYNSLKEENEQLQAQVSSGEEKDLEILSLSQQIDSLQIQIKETADTAAERETTQNTVLAEKQSLAAQLAAMSQEYDALVGQEGEQQQKLRSLEQKIVSLEKSLSEAQAVSASRAERIKELESDIQAKDAALEGEESEAELVVSEWQVSYDELASEKASIEQQLETLTTNYEAAMAKSDQYHSMIEMLEVEKAGLEKAASRMFSLESEIREKDEEIARLSNEEKDSISSWQERNKALEDELESLKSRMSSVASALEEARQRKDEDQAKIIELSNDKEKVEQELREIEEKFAADSEEADEIIDSWKDSHDTLEATKNELEARLEILEAEHTQVISSRDEFMAMADQLQSDLREAQEATANPAELTSLEEEKLSLKNQLDASKSEHEESAARISSLEQMIKDMELKQDETSSRILELEEQVRIKEEELTKDAEDADEVIKEWEQTYNAVVEEKNEVDSLLVNVQKERDDLTTKLDELTVKLDEFATKSTSLEAELQQKETELVKANSELQNKSAETGSRQEQLLSVQTETNELREQIAEANEKVIIFSKKIETLEDEKTELESRLESITQERDELAKLREDDRVGIERLKSELREERDQGVEGFDRVKELQQSLDQVNSRLEEAERANAELQEKCKSLGEFVAGLEATKTELEEKQAGYETALADKEAKVSELEEALEAEVEQADEVIEQWQQSLSAVQQEKEELESKLDSIKERNKTADSERAEELTAQVQGLTSLLHTRDSEHKQLLESFESTLKMYEESKAANSDQVKLLKLKMGRYEEEITLLQEQYDSLTISKSALEKELHEAQQQVETASIEIAERDNALGDYRKKQVEHDADAKRYKEKVDSLAAELQLNAGNTPSEEETKSGPREGSFEMMTNTMGDSNHPPPPTTISVNYTDALSAERKARKSESNRRYRLEIEIETQKTESDRLIRSWKGEAEEFGKLLQKTRAEHDNERKEAASKIEQLEKRCSELESSHSSPNAMFLQNDTTSGDTVSRSKFEDEFSKREKAEKALAEANAKLEDAEKKLKQTQDEYSTGLDSSASQQNESGIEKDHLASVEQELKDLQELHSILKEERDSLRITVAELEGELKDASNELNHYLTNEVSEQATRLAADALQRQIEEMRYQAQVDSSSFSAERSARLAAEQESKRLQCDLAAILGLEYKESNQNEIRRRTAEATEYFQRSERAEMNELKESLDRVVEELAVARQALRAAEDRADIAELRSVQLEQDLVSAKSDLKMMEDMIEDMRDAEASRRASMEYRISAFEDEKNVVRRLHEAEIEGMRNELEQCTMERDSHAQSLQDSEKSRNALLQASSRGRDSDPGQNARAELVRLRMEKAHLLAAASEEASRTERRIRELREAATSSADADILVERELRAAAELALEGAKAELREARSQQQARSTGIPSTPNSKELESEVKKLQEKISTMEKEKEETKNQLDELKESSSKTIESLRDDVRTAKARALQSERAVRHEAEVRAEVARLHDVPNSGDPGTIISTAASYGEYKYSDNNQISHLYELIQTQKQTIEEQREAHSSMETDFEGLLALLAQSKLVEESLSNALVQSQGEKAVQEAIMHAEERAVAQYGTFVRASE